MAWVRGACGADVVNYRHSNTHSLSSEYYHLMFVYCCRPRFLRVPQCCHRHGDDLSGAGALRAAWNVALMRDGLAAAYTSLLLEVSQFTGPGPALAGCAAGLF